MNLFQSICEGLGLAMAAGIFLGALGRPGAGGMLLAALSAAAGAVLFALSLSAHDHSAAGGIPAGAVAGLGAFIVAAGIARGASAREGAAASAVALLIAAAAVLLAAVSLLVPPISIAVAPALVWLWAARRSRAARKYEGLRSLR
jgi:hypothetical protein